MMDAMTEAEFRAFAERLNGFAEDLAPNERHFLTTILARASIRLQPDLDPYSLGPDSSICTELAFSIWRSMSERSIGANPHPIDRTMEDKCSWSLAPVTQCEN